MMVMIRLDKIGDLVSTICVDQLPEVEAMKLPVTWIVQEGLGPIPKHAIPQRRYWELNKNRPFESFRLLMTFLRRQKPEIAVSFQNPWWVSLALWLARVPIRAGVKSQWHSFLFLNRALRQKRSNAEKHEAEYNAELLRFALHGLYEPISNTGNLPCPYFRMKSPRVLKAEARNLPTLPFVVVHPGMAGSALNMRPEYYVQLVEALKARFQIVVTGTKMDRKWTDPLKEAFVDEPKVQFYLDDLSLEELVDVLSASRAVIAPSTGVLHLAAALGVPCFGFYSPVKVQSSVRWKARGARVRLYEPSVRCPAQMQCIGPSCTYFYCMNKIPMGQLIADVKAAIPS